MIETTVYGYSLAELATHEPSDWVADMFPRGYVSALYGDSGIGKSWVMTAVAANITSAKPFINRGSTGSKVLVLDTMGRLPRFAERGRKLGVDYELGHTHCKNVNFFPDVSDAKRLIPDYDYDLIIIDCLLGLVEDKYREWLPILDQIARNKNAAVVFTDCPELTVVNGHISVVWELTEVENNYRQLQMTKNVFGKLSPMLHRFTISSLYSY